jgi:hypothetical protein
MSPHLHLHHHPCWLTQLPGFAPDQIETNGRMDRQMHRQSGDRQTNDKKKIERLTNRRLDM